MWNDIVKWWQGVEEGEEGTTTNERTGGQQSGKQNQRKRSHTATRVEAQHTKGIGNVGVRRNSMGKKPRMTQKHNIAPWDQVPGHWMGREQELKQYIMDIPKQLMECYDIEIPEDYEFDMKNEYNFHMASAALRQDPRLTNCRFQFAAHKNEKGFWRTYFYLVQVIKETRQIHMLKEKLKKIYGSSKHRKKQAELKKVLEEEYETMKQTVIETMNMLNEYNKYKMHRRLGATEDELSPEKVPTEAEANRAMQACIKGKKKISFMIVDITDEAFIMKIDDIKYYYNKLMANYELFKKLNYHPEQMDEAKVYSPKLYMYNEEEEEEKEKVVTCTQCIANEPIRKRIAMHLPTRYQRNNWLRLYSNTQHGSSLFALYHQCNDKGPLLLIVRTSKNELLIFYNGTGFKSNKRSYYGNGESFVCTALPGAKKEADEVYFAYYGWTKRNQFFVLSNESAISIGGGQVGGAALYIDKSLQWGSTHHCETFSSPPLTTRRLPDEELHELGEDNEGDFKIVSLECWKLVYFENE